VLNADKVYICKVERVQVDKQGLQSGLKVSTPELKHWVYIPKFKATPSRFLDLTTKFPLGTEVSVIIDNCSPFLFQLRRLFRNSKRPLGKQHDKRSYSHMIF
jgi:hypothetical protein